MSSDTDISLTDSLDEYSLLNPTYNLNATLNPKFESPKSDIVKTIPKGKADLKIRSLSIVEKKNKSKFQRKKQRVKMSGSDGTPTEICECTDDQKCGLDTCPKCNVPIPIQQPEAVTLIHISTTINQMVNTINKISEALDTLANQVKKQDNRLESMEMTIDSLLKEATSGIITSTKMEANINDIKLTASNTKQVVEENNKSLKLIKKDRETIIGEIKVLQTVVAGKQPKQTSKIGKKRISTSDKSSEDEEGKNSEDEELTQESEKSDKEGRYEVPWTKQDKTQYESLPDDCMFGKKDIAQIKECSSLKEFKALILTWGYSYLDDYNDLYTQFKSSSLWLRPLMLLEASLRQQPKASGSTSVDESKGKGKKPQPKSRKVYSSDEDEEELERKAKAEKDRGSRISRQRKTKVFGKLS